MTFHLSLNFRRRMCAGGIAGPSIVKESLPPSNGVAPGTVTRLLMRLFVGGGRGGVGWRFPVLINAASFLLTVCR